MAPAILQQHIAIHLSCHDDDVTVTIDASVAGEQADARRAKLVLKVVEFLVGERLERRRVNDALATRAARAIKAEV